MIHQYTRRPKNGKKYKGVYIVRNSYGSKYIIARITCKGITYSLGGFFTEEKAARAYDRAALEMFGEGCYLNFPLTKVN